MFCLLFFFFFFNDTATTEIYTLSLHDALPICARSASWPRPRAALRGPDCRNWCGARGSARVNAWSCSTRARSEEHTSELQSQFHLVCRLLLEKKKKSKASHSRHTSYYSPPAES